MNSILDDLENAEDLNELESRLYAQIHHEAPTHDTLTPQLLQFEEQSVVHRLVTSTSVINNASELKLSNRYWVNSQNTQQVGQRKKWPSSNSKNYIEIVNTDNQISQLREKTFKPFQVYEPIISNLIDKIENETIFNPNELSVYQKNATECDKNKYIKIDEIESIVSKNNVAHTSKKQTQKEKYIQNQGKHVSNKNCKFKELVKEKELEGQIHKKVKYKETLVSLQKDEPLLGNFLKKQRALKFQAKKIKSKAARQKNFQKRGKIQTISFNLISDDDDEDDVIVVPVPPPPILTINDSSEEEEVPNNKKLNLTEEMSTSRTEVSFAKPKTVKVLNKTVSNITDSNSSRCASPSSVISNDDFIGQADRSRLLHDRIIVNDDDLICLGDNLETYAENEHVQNFSVKNDKNYDLISQINANNRKTPLKTNNYRGTQDVYCESESDITESTYSKSSAMQSHVQSKTSIIIETLSETNTDCMEANNPQKIKRLRKRRASSSNKETELNNDSTDSDREETMIPNEVNSTLLTTLPYITRGEAVETCKIKKKRISQSTRFDNNSSDNEFINMLQTFSQGKACSTKIISLEHYSDESTKSEEDLTARRIAEEILNKRVKKCKQSDIENSNVCNLIQDSIRIEHSNENSDCVIPTLNIELMEKQFDTIDKIAINEFKSIDTILNNEIESDHTDIINIEERQCASKNSNIYNVIHTNSKNIGWSEEMFRFYNCSWGGEKFNVNLIRKKMDRKARWTIYTEDRFPKYKKYSNVRCNNCSEIGHMQAKCPQSKKPLRCSMCGQTGHREPRCPNTICLRCGNKTRVFIKSCNACTSQNRLICPICKIRGHGIDLCPDKWRRYHSTIINNAQPNSTISYNPKKYCCICAGRGHLSEQCKVAYRFSEYPQSLTEIKSHCKSYDDQKKQTTLPNINSYNLLYEPDDSINFNFSVNSKITTKQYYGRFLKAVGLNHIISSVVSNKRKLPIFSCTEVEMSKEKNRKTNRNNRKSQDTDKNINNKSKNLVRNPLAIFEKSSLNALNNKEGESSVEISLNTSIKDSFNCDMYESNQTEELVLPEHKFKSPYILVDKSIESSEQTELNKSKDNSQNTGLKESLNLDSDSNYSFSEHFENNMVTSTPGKISRPMETLPDFIPLNNHDNIDGGAIVNHENLKVSTDINPNSDDDTTEFENTFQLNDIPCVAKIYLKKDFSDYLLSPEGNRFLVDNSNKFDVKASIDWTRVGNILVLEGLRANQDKFHTELLLAFRFLPDKLNRKELENTQQVPRKRIKMIRFLAENLRLLQKSNFLSADVNLLFKQLKDYENKNSQTSWKMAEKTRRTLNMILFGKIGLRDGKRNLDILVNSLKSLALISEQEFITNEMREDINKSWKYIFSSQKHENYEELVELFYEMKRKNIFPKLKIDERLLSKNFLTISLTEKEKNEIFSDCNYYNTNSINNLKQQSQEYNSNSNDSNVSSKTMAKVILDTTEPVISKDLSNISLNISNIKNNSVTQSFTEFLSENLANESSKLEWENRCIKLLTQIENCTKNTSIYWSKQSVKIINNCLYFSNSHPLLNVQLQKILQKANKGLLSYDDHRDILKIYNSKISNNS